MSDLSKKFSIHSCSSSLNSFFFFLTYYVQLYVDWIFWLEFQSPWPSFADWMGVIFHSCEHFSSKFILLKMLNVWFVLFLRLTLQCWLVIVLSFFKRYSLTRAASSFLDTAYFFGCTISYINYWDQVNSWKNLWKFWNDPLCRNKSGNFPSTHCCRIAVATPKLTPIKCPRYLKTTLII